MGRAMDTTIAVTLNPQAIRLKKEARALFWPWCAIMIAGALPIVVPHVYAEPFSFLSFFMGVPLLASLSLGNEFREHTLSLWLSQPRSRMQLWWEKMIVMFPAVLTAGFVSGTVMFQVTWPHMRLTYKAAALVYIFVAMAAATFWTAALRSTVGGLMVISFMLFAGSLFSGGIEDKSQAGKGLVAWLSPAASILLLFTLGLCFTVLMLWLGARKLTRLQVAGGSAEGDLLVSGPVLLPARLSDWLHCRTSDAFLNLIREELRLLRPVWLMGLFVGMYAACLAVFHLLPAPPTSQMRTVFKEALMGILGSVCIGAAGLAGIISLGEERASGTQAWHMTLPISVGRQWLVKLVVAIVAGLSCAVLSPILTMMAVGAAYGSWMMYVNPGILPDILILFAILTFICFWCACAANGTVRAALWAVPVTAAIPFASKAGIWLGSELANATGTLEDFVVSSFHLSPLALTSLIDFANTHVLWLFVPTLMVALFQSYRLFRTPPQNSALWMLRCLLPLVAVTLLWSFLASAGFLSSQWQPFDEARHALDALRPGTTNLELTGKELTNHTQLTPLTRRWLEGSIVTVAPDPSHSLAHSLGYLATIRLAGGRECRLTVTPSGASAASCAK